MYLNKFFFNPVNILAGELYKVLDIIVSLVSQPTLGDALAVNLSNILLMHIYLPYISPCYLTSHVMNRIKGV